MYAAVVDAMDQAIGQVLDTLDSEGLTDNTIVLFFSDNGGAAYSVGGADNARSQSAMIHSWLPSLTDRRGVVLVMALLWICTVPRTPVHHVFPKTSFSWA